MAVNKFYKQLTSPDVDQGNGVRSFTETWLIDLDDPKTPQLEIENNPSYPYEYQLHPVRQQFFAVNRKLDQDLDAPNVRKLVVEWTTKLGDVYYKDGSPIYPINPLERPARVVWGTYKTVLSKLNVYARKLNTPANLFAIDPSFGYNVDSNGNDVDKNGNITAPQYPPKNTAGDALFLQDQDDFRVLSFMKNVQQVPLFMTKSGQFLNSDTVKIRGITFKPLSLLAADIQMSDYRFEGGKPFFELTWNFYVDEVNFWYTKKRNTGFNEKVTKYQDRDGNDSPGPVPGGKTYDVLRPIVVGPVDNRHYPSQPVLLRPNGRAIRTMAKGDDPKSPQDWTGEIMTTESKNEDLRDQSQKDSDWSNAEIWMRTKPAIPFNKFFPMN